MRIPKYIDEALKRRTNTAYKLIKYDCIISDYNVDKLSESEDEFVDLIASISKNIKNIGSAVLLLN